MWLSRATPHQVEGVGSIPGQSTCLGWGFSPQSDSVGEVAS